MKYKLTKKTNSLKKIFESLKEFNLNYYEIGFLVTLLDGPKSDDSFEISLEFLKDKELIDLNLKEFIKEENIKILGKIKKTDLNLEEQLIFNILIQELIKKDNIVVKNDYEYSIYRSEVLEILERKNYNWAGYEKVIEKLVEKSFLKRRVTAPKKFEDTTYYLLELALWV